MRPVRRLMLVLAPALAGACAEPAGSPLQPGADVTAAADFEEILFEVRGNRSLAQTFSSGFRDDTLTRVLVTVFSNNDSTLLSYDVNKCPFPFLFCFSTERGFGLIPGVDLAVTGSGAMRLHTNTGGDANPAFQRTAGAGGEIDVTWTPTLGGATSDQNGTSTFLMGGEFTRTSGRISSTDADVSGAVVGTPVNQGSRQAFTSTRVGMTVQVVRSQ